jgi:hypothetical protein
MPYENEQRKKGILAKQNYMRERNGAPKQNVLMSRSPVANPKSGPDYSVFIIKYTGFSILHTPKGVFVYPRLKSTDLDYIPDARY